MSRESSSPSVIRCFNQKLDPFESAQNIVYKSVNASGKTTKETDPPQVLLHSPIKQFEDTANKALDDLRVTQKGFDLKTIAPYRPEVSQNTEAEVVTTSWTYIIEPILDIFNAIYPLQPFTVHQEDIHCEEVTNNSDNKGQKAQTSPELRYDLVFKTRETEYKQPTIIAVIEYKRRALIRPKDFKVAILPGHASPQDIEKAIDNAEKAPTRTLLRSNAIPYTKQVSAYAARTQCKHVALFNWDHLLIFNFHELKPGQGKNDATAGKSPKVSWVSEGRDHDEFMEAGYIRMVLLGWLIRAFEEAGILME